MNVEDRPRFRPQLKLPGLLSEIIGTIVFVIAVTVLFDMAIPRSLVEGHSMEPTFYGQDRLVVSRLNYLFGEPEYLDIVVFNSVNPSEEGVMLIKRVIGMPGDTIKIENSKVFRNGEELTEAYINEACIPARCRDNEWELGDDEYFLMGDNRNRSNDSRSFGAVPKGNIVGEVIFRYWPVPSFGIISK